LGRGPLGGAGFLGTLVPPAARARPLLS
jgi:hypothetical protein